MIWTQFAYTSEVQKNALKAALFYVLVSNTCIGDHDHDIRDVLRLRMLNNRIKKNND